jgi:hypothetical protein
MTESYQRRNDEKHWIIIMTKEDKNKKKNEESEAKERGSLWTKYKGRNIGNWPYFVTDERKWLHQLIAESDHFKKI